MGTPNGSWPYSQLSLKGGVLKIHGDPTKPIHPTTLEGSTNYFQRFDQFPGIQSSLTTLGGGRIPKISTASVYSFEIKWFKLHGPTLSSELQTFPHLQSLRLENVTISDFLQPTNLPRLKEFLLSQVLVAEQNLMEEYKVHNFHNVSQNISYPFLDSTFFYMGEKFRDFNTELRSTRVNISVWLDGSILFSKDAAKRELRLALRTCQPILSLQDVPYESLTLGNCNDLQPDSLPHSTKSLSVYLLDRDSVNKDSLRSMLKGLTKLEELYLELPWDGMELDLTSLPSALRLLSVSSMRIVLPVSAGIPTFLNLSAFYFGGSNQYRFVSDGTGTESEPSQNFLANFNIIFPAIREAAVFELNETRYAYLQTLLNSSASVITVQGFARSHASTKAPLEAKLETILTDAGIPPDSEFFELVKGGGGLKGRNLEYDEQIKLRFNMLGWAMIDSRNKYVYVRNLIDNGFFLGWRKNVVIFTQFLFLVHV